MLKEVVEFKISGIIGHMKTSQQSQSQPHPEMPPPAHKVWVMALVAVLASACGFATVTKYQVPSPFSPSVTVETSTPTVIPSVAAETSTPTASPSPAPTATQDPTTGWKTYQNAAMGFTYKYPPELTAGDNSPVTVETISDFKKTYSPANFPDGCPSICGNLIDPQTLEKQFSILRQAQACEMSDSFEADVKKNFILFGGGIYSIIDVEKISSPYLKICGLKILDYGSFTVDLNDYGYKDVFLLDDKVILAAISPFKLSEADSVWNGIGRTTTDSGGWMCDAACGQKELDYYNQMSNSPLADPIIQIGKIRVDQILSTFQFTQ